MDNVEILKLMNECRDEARNPAKTHALDKNVYKFHYSICDDNIACVF